MVLPPSTTIFAPVIKLASSEAKNLITAAYSDDSDILFIGISSSAILVAFSIPNPVRSIELCY